MDVDRGTSLRQSEHSAYTASKRTRARRRIGVAATSPTHQQHTLKKEDTLGNMETLCVDGANDQLMLWKNVHWVSRVSEK